MTITHLENTTSTSDYLLNLHTDKDVVAVADYQSAGRGAGTNSWESAPGKNLLFSMLIHPTWLEPRNQFLLSMVHALALVDVLSEYSEGFTIKWPNDIYWQNSKISGTIIDCTLKGGKIADAVIGTGVNINQEVFLSDAPNPVSLYQITGKKYDCREILDKIIRRFQHYHIRMAERGKTENYKKIKQKIIDLYHERLYRNDGAFHLYEDKDGQFEAELVQVLPTGIMQLRRRNGPMKEYEFKQVKYIF